MSSQASRHRVGQQLAMIASDRAAVELAAASSVEGQLNLGDRAEPDADPQLAYLKDQRGYRWNEDVTRLVEGFVWTDMVLFKTEEVESSWADLRSTVERTGNVEWEGFIQVLDLERAVAALREEHPYAALVVVAVMMGWETEELERTFGGLKMGWGLALAKSKAFITAWLSGKDAGSAYRRTRR